MNCGACSKLQPIPHSLAAPCRHPAPNSWPFDSAGASIIWNKNYLMADLAQAAGLERQQLEGDGLLAVYDGQILVFEVC